MPTWDDVVAIGRTLPEAEVSTWYRTPALRVGKKGFVRLRTESDGGLVVVCHLDDKDALIAKGDPAFYTTPHYDGYGAILVDLQKVDREMLTVLVSRAWALKAPARLRKLVPEAENTEP